MEWLRERIDEVRNIKPNSLRAYIISIKKIRDAMDYKKEDLDFLEDIDKVKEFLSKFKTSTKKNYLAAIIVALDSYGEKYDDELQKYKKYLDETHTQYKEEYENGKKSEKQEKNWVSLEQLRKVSNYWKRELNEREIFQKKTLNNKQMQMLQKWVVSNLFTSDDNPPTRLDYAPMEIISTTEYDKLKEDEKKSGNFLVVKNRNEKFFHFNEYKTSGKYGEKVVKVGKKLNSVINIWLKFNESDSFLINTKGEPLSANGLGKLIKSTFASTGKDITINMLRHIFISEKFPNVDDEREEVAEKMGHSISQQAKYSKR